MHAHDIVLLCSIAAAGFCCQWLAWRTRIPAILFLLLLGLAAGPLFGWLRPDELFGELLVPFVSIGVAIILFEGSLTLKFAEIRGHGSVVRNLVSIGVVITWICSGLAAYLLFGWDLYLSALFGAIVTVSGPTVVIPLLRSVRPTRAVSDVLRWEAILIDPIGAMLGLLVFDFILATRTADGLHDAIITAATIAAAGVSLGALGGYVFGLTIRARKIPDFLRDYAALGFVLAIFGAAEHLHSESGLLAVTVMGVWLANMKGVDLEDVVSFKESLTLLLVAGLFIVLSARIEFAALASIGVKALILVLLLQVLAGPLRAFVCAAGSGLDWRQKLFIGWTFPRGIVAAAVSAIFALRLSNSGYPNSNELVSVVFSVILGTVIIQSLTSAIIARWLKVVEPDPSGFLIVGSNRVALALAKALKDNGISVMVADSDWDGIQEARMAGFRAFYGSPVSGYADTNMDLTGLGYLLAVSQRPGLNELACVKFAAEFGRHHVYTVSNHFPGEHDKHRVSGEYRGRVLFGGDMTLSQIMVKMSTGGRIRSTELSEEFDMAKYQQRNPDSLLIFASDARGRIHFATGEDEFSPAAGWTVTSLLPA